MPPGPHRVRVWYLHFAVVYGEREMDVHVQPDGVTRLFYASPRHILGRASLGLRPQQSSWQVDRREARSSCTATLGCAALLLVLLVVAGAVVALWQAVLG